MKAWIFLDKKNEAPELCTFWNPSFPLQYIQFLSLVDVSP